MVTLRYGGEVNGILGQGDWERWWYMNCEGRRKDAALDVSVVNPLQQQLAGKEKRESNMPSISKWGNTVIDARRRESCSLGGYESPWAPGGAIFTPGEIMTRREYWKPFFFTVKSFLEGASWWSQLPLGPNWHLQLLQLLLRYIEAGGIPSILFH